MRPQYLIYLENCDADIRLLIEGYTKGSFYKTDDIKDAFSCLETILEQENKDNQNQIKANYYANIPANKYTTGRIFILDANKITNLSLSEIPDNLREIYKEKILKIMDNWYHTQMY